MASLMLLLASPTSVEAAQADGDAPDIRRIFVVSPVITDTPQLRIDVDTIRGTGVDTARAIEVDVEVNGNPIGYRPLGWTKPFGERMYFVDWDAAADGYGSIRFLGSRITYKAKDGSLATVEDTKGGGAFALQTDGRMVDVDVSYDDGDGQLRVAFGLERYEPAQDAYVAYPGARVRLEQYENPKRGFLPWEKVATFRVDEQGRFSGSFETAPEPPYFQLRTIEQGALSAYAQWDNLPDER